MSSQLDRLLEPFRKMVTAVLSDKNIDYLATYPCKVILQHGTAAGNDVTLDVEAERAGLALPQRLPVKFGTPATTADFANGMRVYVAFENGDPSAPYVCGYDPVVAGAVGTVMFGGTKGVARVDDPVNAGVLTIAAAPTAPPGGTILTFTYTPPGGSPQVTILTFAAAIGVLTSGGTASITGKISSGSTKLKVG